MNGYTLMWLYDCGFNMIKCEKLVVTIDFATYTHGVFFILIKLRFIIDTDQTNMNSIIMIIINASAF